MNKDKFVGLTQARLIHPTNCAVVGRRHQSLAVYHRLSVAGVPRLPTKSLARLRGPPYVDLNELNPLEI